MLRLAPFVMVIALFSAPAARAYEWWELELLGRHVGDGPHSVLFVVDFWSGTDGDSFAFAYHFEAEEITGLQLMDALAAAGIGFDYAEVGGGYITDIWYTPPGGPTYHAIDNWPATWISYWLSSDLGETWEFSPVGPAQRILRDGDTDGRLCLPGDDWTSTPQTPLAPLPGDTNCDGVVSFLDINPFVLALTAPEAYTAAFPDCALSSADCDRDGVVDFRDINTFVGLFPG